MNCIFKDGYLKHLSNLTLSKLHHLLCFQIWFLKHWKEQSTFQWIQFQNNGTALRKHTAASQTKQHTQWLLSMLARCVSTACKGLQIFYFYYYYYYYKIFDFQLQVKPVVYNHGETFDSLIQNQFISYELRLKSLLDKSLFSHRLQHWLPLTMSYSHQTPHKRIIYFVF